MIHKIVSIDRDTYGVLLLCRHHTALTFPEFLAWKPGHTECPTCGSNGINHPDLNPAPMDANTIAALFDTLPQPEPTEPGVF